MTVRHLFAAVAALFVLLFGAGCRRGDSAALPAETDEPAFVQGMQMKKHGRHSEALTAFLKVVARRGEAPSPESHLEAGLLYLEHAKDPVQAYYHFRKYLELQPNSKQAPGVKGKSEAALREFLRSIPTRPLEDQSARLEVEEELARLRRENSELRAENQTLRGGEGMVQRVTRSIPLTPEQRPATPPPVATAVESPLVPAPLPNRSTPPPAVQNVQNAPQTQRVLANSPITPSRGTIAPPTTPRGRTHTVGAREGLLAIARRFDSANPGRKMREIIAANPDVLPDGERTPLKPGMVLRIP